ncbi:MAG: ImmA/IrrE family metallo-endopeptidase [Bacteroidetes bacterium]|nr:ImmA/IrrE family metallo-endopeptidase [Bacteroidota bacterium]
MKHWAPPPIELRPDQLTEAKRVATLLSNHSHGDIDLWVSMLGFAIERHPLLPPVNAIIIKQTIIIRKGMTRIEEIRAIAHEYAHHKFHPRAVQFRDLPSRTIAKNEGQAKAFAEEVLIYST